MVKSAVKYMFGGKLREVRERKNITLKEVARRAGVSESLVSQIERNKVSPSIDTLLTIADVLDIDHEYLFTEYKRIKQVSIVRRGQGSTLALGRVTLRQLSRVGELSDDHAVEAFMLEIGVGSEKGDLEYGHTGKEFGIILEGSCDLVYGTSTYRLDEGDSVSFSSDIPHTLKNTGDQVLKALWVITPPRLLFARK
ncbi:cupin domain-containing protein [Desulfatiferula olefinivorans]